MDKSSAKGSKKEILTDKIYVEKRDGSRETRKWIGYYSPTLASLVSFGFGTRYKHLRFENGVPVVKEVSIFELEKRNKRVANS